MRLLNSTKLDGGIVTERGIAGELLNRWGDRLKSTGMERKVGRFAGFGVFVGSTYDGDAQVILKGAAQHSTRVQPTAVGMIRSVEHLVNALEDTVAQAEAHLSQGRRRLADLETQAAQPFEYAAKLAELVQRQQELVAALDLTKGQATGSLAADLTLPGATNEPASLQEGDWSW